MLRKFPKGQWEKDTKIGTVPLKLMYITQRFSNCALRNPKV
jgi:hypothetical protein